MKKINPKIIIAVLVAILFIFSLVYVFSQKNSSPSGNTASQNSSNTQATIMLPISTPNGEVSVKDFRANPLDQEKGTMLIAETPEYRIVYFGQDQTFTITLQSKPLQQARDAAEAKFLDYLGISKGQACKLTVSVTIPYEVDAQLSGKDFGLGFCPNSEQF